MPYPAAAPCDPTPAWHACLPALTIAPELRTATVDTLLRLGGATFIFDLALPVGVVVTARARVARERDP